MNQQSPELHRDPVEVALEDVLELVGLVRLEYRRAKKHHRQVAPDGFPSTSGAAGRGAPTNEIDPVDGVPIPQRSDPTLAAVVARDEQRVSLRRIHTNVNAARKALDVAVGQARKSREAQEQQLPEGTNDATPVWCSWHTEIVGSSEPVHSGSLCQFCYDWSAAVKAERGTVRRPGDRKLPAKPPARILELRAEGRRVTTRTLDEVLAADRQQQRRRGKRAA